MIIGKSVSNYLMEKVNENLLRYNIIFRSVNLYMCMSDDI